MTASTQSAAVTQTDQRGWLRRNQSLLLVMAVMMLFPFIVALANGENLADVFSNEAGNSKFYQGLLIEVFILAIYALSYDLILGVTGLLSFGHAMFFAVGAYLTGALLKSFGWPFGLTVLAVVLAGVLNALLFSVVLPRVKGITFALVTLGFASVFYIIIQTRELGEYTGADVGLQGVIPPAFLDPTNERLRFYFIALFFTLLVYLFYKRFVDSPTGRVCIAIRENENRALMLGFNTFHYKLTALIISAITAGLAGLMHALYQPIISPNIASLSFTVAALLMILIGGVGTLTGAVVGAATFRLLEFFLDRYFGNSASFILGVVYVGIVLFLPFGIVGTWRRQAFRLKEGWQQLAKRLTGK